MPTSFERFLLLILLSLCSWGCGSSSEISLDPATTSGLASGGYRVAFTPDQLAGLFPDPLALPVKQVDPEVAKLTLMVYAKGTLVAHRTAVYSFGDDYTESVDSIPIAPHDVILAARDLHGDLVGSVKAPAVFPLGSSYQLLPPGLFSELQGLVLPDGV